MVHYPRIISNIGPLRGVWSMHQSFKTTASNITCRTNLIHSLSIKNQLKLANLLANYDNVEKNTEAGPKHKVSKTFLISISWLKIDIVFKPNNVFQTGNYEDDVPIFSIIRYILNTSHNNYIFCCQSLEDMGWHLLLIMDRNTLDLIFQPLRNQKYLVF